jgi:serine/threonine protein kinase
MFLVCQLENLLLDIAGNLKISDFGLSAISDQVKVLPDNKSERLQKLLQFHSVSLHFTNLHCNS